MKINKLTKKFILEYGNKRKEFLYIEGKFYDIEFIKNGKDGTGYYLNEGGWGFSFYKTLKVLKEQLKILKESYKND